MQTPNPAVFSSHATTKTSKSVVRVRISLSLLTVCLSDRYHQTSLLKTQDPTLLRHGSQGGHVKKTVVLTIAALLLLGIGMASAERGTGNRSVLSARGASSAPPESQVPDGTPDSILSLAMAGRESWDFWDSPNNELLSEILGAGAEVTGVGWRQLEIVTVPDTGSWRWDAVISLYSTHPDGFFLDAAPGAGDGPGAGIYSSGGILDLGDLDIDNLPIGDDGLLYVQFWEDPDDVEDAIDANYPGGAFDIAYISGVPVPTVPAAALAGLGLLLLVSGGWLITRKSARQ